MTKEDILRMACEAGGVIYEVDYCFEIQNLERFAVLIAAAEREACAKVCERLIKPNGPVPGHPLDAWLMGAVDCAAAIRARGEK